MDEIKYLVTAEKFLEHGAIQESRSLYEWNEFIHAQSLMARLLLDEGYSKASIEVIKLAHKED